MRQMKETIAEFREISTTIPVAIPVAILVVKKLRSKRREG